MFFRYNIERRIMNKFDLILLFLMLIVYVTSVGLQVESACTNK